jgi:hypothetical protein
VRVALPELVSQTILHAARTLYNAVL